MKKLISVIVTLSFVLLSLAGCLVEVTPTSAPVETEAPTTEADITTPTIEPTDAPAETAEPTLEPTAAAEEPGTSPTQSSEASVDEMHEFTVLQGGYSFEAPYGNYVSIRAGDALVGSSSTPLNVIIMGKISKYDLLDAEALFPQMFEGIFGPSADIIMTDPVPYTLDGVEGYSVNYDLQSSSLYAIGEGVVLKPSPNRYIFVLAMAELSGDPELWVNSGEAFFNSIMGSLQVLSAEEIVGYDVCPASEDPTYGFSEENAIRVGGGAVLGPARARAYLENLVTPAGEWAGYERQGSSTFGDTILDLYSVYIGDETFELYVDQYSYSAPLAPVGINCKGAFPLAEPLP